MPTFVRSIATTSFLFVLVAGILVGCSGGKMMLPPPSPIFSSTPVTSAVEGTAYSYQIAATDPAGGMVTFALAEGPTGAVLNSGTLSWTPTGAQSRIADSFTVRATTTGGGTATQSWSVTPNGTVHLTWVDMYWTATGTTAVPFDWTQHPGPAAEVAALVPQADGSLLSLTGTGNADGTFNIPNVPGGHYWLHIAPLAIYWTSSSNFDFGSDIVGTQANATSGSQKTIFNVNATALDPLQAGDWFAFVTDVPLLDLDFPAFAPPGSTTFQLVAQISGNVDFSHASSAFLMQYEPVSLGSFKGLSLGPELIVQNPAFQVGTTNNVNGALNASAPSSFPLSINGSQWVPLFAAASPTAATPIGSVLTVSAQPFVTGRLARPLSSLLGPDLPLVSPVSVSGIPFVLSSAMSSCANTSGSSSISLPPGLPVEPITSQPPLLTDENFGALQYGDPFPAAWTRFFSFCQKATVAVPLPNSTATTPFVLVYGQNTALPTAAVAPLVSAVQNPTINGASLLTASTINTTPITLSWNAPSGMKPFGYTVQLFVAVTPPNGTTQYFPSEKFTSAETSMTLPVTLKAAQSFVVLITAIVDGQASAEMSPRRSGLPTAYASMVSAPIMIGGAAAPQIIRGDPRVVPAGRPVEAPSDPLHIEVQRIH
jgi:hypothetical protein